jgi:hypothetical protein
MRLACLLAVPAALTLSMAAEAAPRSLASATARLPDTTAVLGSSNVKSFRSTQIFQKAFPELVKQTRELREGIDRVKKLCKIDPVTSVEDATLATDKNDEGAAFIALTGIDEAKAVDCATKLAKDEMGGNVKAEKVASKADGTIYRLSTDKSKDEAFFAWLPGEVVVFGTDVDDKALLEKTLSGKGALAKRSKLSGRLSKLDPNAVLSMIWAKEQKIEGKKIKGGDANVTIQSGNVAFAGTAEMESSQEAQEVAALVQALKSMIGKFSPGASVDARSSGAEVIVTARISESDLLKALKDAISGKF